MTHLLLRRLALIAWLVPVMHGQLRHTSLLKPDLLIQSGHRPLSLAFSPDARFFSGGYDGIVKVWDIAGGLLRDILVSGEAYSVAFLKDSFAVANGTAEIQIFDLAGKRLRATLTSPSGTGSLRCHATLIQYQRYGV